MSTLSTRIDKGLYPNFARNWDDQMFRQRILACLRPESVALDLARRRIIAQMDFRDCAAQIYGVDLTRGWSTIPCSSRVGSPTQTKFPMKVAVSTSFFRTMFSNIWMSRRRSSVRSHAFSSLAVFFCSKRQTSVTTCRQSRG